MRDSPKLVVRIAGEGTAKKSISLPNILLVLGQTKQKEKRLSTFSDYVQDLIRRDTDDMEVTIGRR